MTTKWTQLCWNIFTDENQHIAQQFLKKIYDKIEQAKRDYHENHLQFTDDVVQKIINQHVVTNEPTLQQINYICEFIGTEFRDPQQLQVYVYQYLDDVDKEFNKLFTE
jgi:hypothetical protein